MSAPDVEQGDVDDFQQTVEHPERKRISDDLIQLQLPTSFETLSAVELERLLAQQLVSYSLDFSDGGGTPLSLWGSSIK